MSGSAMPESVPSAASACSASSPAVISRRGRSTAPAADSRLVVSAETEIGTAIAANCRRSSRSGRVFSPRSRARSRRNKQLRNSALNTSLTAIPAKISLAIVPQSPPTVCSSTPTAAMRTSCSPVSLIAVYCTHSSPMNSALRIFSIPVSIRQSSMNGNACAACGLPRMPAAIWSPHSSSPAALANASVKNTENARRSTAPVFPFSPVASHAADSREHAIVTPERQPVCSTRYTELASAVHAETLCTCKAAEHHAIDKAERLQGDICRTRAPGRIQHCLFPKPHLPAPPPRVSI